MVQQLQCEKNTNYTSSFSCLDASTLFHFLFEKKSTTTVCTWTATIYRGVKR